MELSAEFNITGYILEYSTYHYTYHIAKSATDKNKNIVQASNQHPRS